MREIESRETENKERKRETKDTGKQEINRKRRNK